MEHFGVPDLRIPPNIPGYIKSTMKGDSSPCDYDGPAYLAPRWLKHTSVINRETAGAPEGVPVDALFLNRIRR